MPDNPNWDEVLNYIPEDKRDEAKEVFSTWDKNYQELNEQYAPYKEVVSNWDPSTLNEALGVASKLAEDPVYVYNQLHEYLQEQGQLPNTVPTREEPEADDDDIEFVNDPRIQALMDSNKALLEEAQARRQAEEDSMAIEEFDAELSAMRERYGEFDENFVIAQVAAGMDTEDAVQAYQAWEEQMRERLNRPSIPRPLAASGVFEMGNKKVDFSKLSDDERKREGVAWLQALNENF